MKSSSTSRKKRTRRVLLECACYLVYGAPNTEFETGLPFREAISKATSSVCMCVGYNMLALQHGVSSNSFSDKRFTDRLPSRACIHPCSCDFHFGKMHANLRELDEFVPFVGFYFGWGVKIHQSSKFSQKIFERISRFDFG